MQNNPNGFFTKLLNKIKAVEHVVEVKYISPDDGLEIIRSLLPQCYNHLCPEGVILMETGEYNALDAQKIASSHRFRTVLHKDLEGQLRVVECQKERFCNPL